MTKFFTHQLVLVRGVRYEMIRAGEQTCSVRALEKDGFTSNPNGVRGVVETSSVKPV